MTPRGLLTAIGATALGLGVVIGGASGMPDAFAQEAATPPAQTRQANDFEAQRAQAYDGFVAALAGELGDDEAAVDTAIRTALKQQVDERQTAGDLDAEQAAAMQAVIDVSEAPLFSGFAGRGGMHGFAGHGDFKGRGPRGGDDDWAAQRSGGGQLPAQLGDDDQGSDQSAPAPAAPTTDAVIG